MRWSLLGLILAASLARGQQLTLPATITAIVGDPIVVEAVTDCTDLKWVSLDGLKLIPQSLLKDTHTAVAFARNPGTYSLRCYGAKDGKASNLAVCVIKVESSPMPPGPVPPGPEPPLPPPTPEDSLVRAIRGAWDLDLNPDKKRHLGVLIEVWSQGVTLCADEKILTAGQLLGILREATASLSGTNLKGVRTVIGEELRKSMPLSPDTVLTPELRKQSATLFDRIAKALKKLESS